MIVFAVINGTSSEHMYGAPEESGSRVWCDPGLDRFRCEALDLAFGCPPAVLRMDHKQEKNLKGNETGC